MVQYNFKQITVVPTAKDFVDIVLSKTQRKTPTVIHRHYQISRIRQFYTRKVKFTQQTFYDKLTAIVTEFPRLEELHPFYADLINALYDRDHYKLALGQINTARHLVARVGQDYSRLLKYGDSLYRCKQLKRAALGRMATIMRGQSSTLAYLEQVRQHLSRLPSINPTGRSLILCGFPNVGKSSFLNKMTRADVEVQPYPFTTRSLYVGHMDHEYLRWQVIDTPGILDHPLEDRNNIEMLAITALAHLRAAVLFFLDLSGQCGYTVPQQVHLFNSIRPLFANKPLVVCANKADVLKIAELDEESRALLDGLQSEGVPVMEMSNLTEEGLIRVKNEACDLLLKQRVEAKLAGKKIGEPRDDKPRPPMIPEAVTRKRQLAAQGIEVEKKPRKLEREIELEMGHDYVLDLQKNWLLEKEEWKQDAIPEIWEGHNIQDFIDPDILERLRQLEREEDARAGAGYYDIDQPESDDEMQAIRHTARLIREKKALRKLESRERKGVKGAKMPRTGKKMSTDDVEEGMEELGVDVDADATAHMSAGRSRSRLRDRSAQRRRDADVAADEERRSRSRSRSRPPRSESGVRDAAMAGKARLMAKQSQRKNNQLARKGEADRHVFIAKPKHLFSGKRGIGKTDRR
uniref:Nucleolar GTP-binding protein 1 n=1 Tax=Macrostomum lignano TaxID=282301 RepID=A0A1I8G4F0_9PLAT